MPAKSSVMMQLAPFGLILSLIKQPQLSRSLCSASARHPHALLNEEGVDLPRWVQSMVREEWTSEVFDLELYRDQNAEEEMVQLLQLAIDCATQYPDKRLSMSEVTRQIEELCRSSLPDDPQPDVEKETD